MVKSANVKLIEVDHQLGVARCEINRLRADALIKDGVIAELRAAAVSAKASAPPASAIQPNQDELDDLNRVCRLLMAEWERVEHRPVGMSFVTTFVDLARAAINDRELTLRGVRSDLIAVRRMLSATESARDRALQGQDLRNDAGPSTAEPAMKHDDSDEPHMGDYDGWG